MGSLSAKAKSQIYSNLEKYARSGMGMEKACESLLGQRGVPGAERRIYKGILKGLGEGRGIGESLGCAGNVVSSLEEEVVTAAESGGMLEKGFGHLAVYFRRISKTRRQVVKGLTYPLVLLHLAVPVTTLAATVSNNFALDGTGGATPFRDSLIASGKAMLIIYAIIVVVLAGGAILHRLSRHSGFIDVILNRVPILGPVRKYIAMERFTQVFEIFLHAGRKMSDSIHGAGKASGSGILRSATKKGAGIIEKGGNVTEALQASRRAFPKDFIRGMAAAEESGQMDRELAEWGRFYSDATGEAMESLAEWTPKLFYWGILLFVAYLIIKAALAYRDLIERLLEFSF
ncbi:MAG: type II secretion system F family protein [Verrucomicrobiales bacterium]|nr:type II secretion system F family protein [Verrucomicrobiales bacterium]